MQAKEQLTKKDLSINAKQEQKIVKQGKGKWGHNSKYIPNTKHGSPSNW